MGSANLALNHGLWTEKVQRDAIIAVVRPLR